MGKFREKQFHMQASLFTLLQDNKNFMTIKYFVYICCALLAINTCLEDIFYDGKSQFGFFIIRAAFANFEYAVRIWILLFFIHICVYFLWNLWYKSNICWKWWNLAWILFIIYMIFALLYYTVKACHYFNLAIASRCALLMELIRLIMKSYAFIRTSSRDAISKENFVPPTFSQYIYFSFAPTMIFSQKYPLWASRDFNLILSLIVDFFLQLYFAGIINYKYFYKPLKEFGTTPFTWIDIVSVLISNALPAFICFFILLVTSLLYTTQELFAELLRFGDRKYFTDWWNVTNLPKYFTSENLVTNEWIYFYLYQDLRTIFVRQKYMPRLLILTISTILHEYLFIGSTEVCNYVFSFCMLGGLLDILLFRNLKRSNNIFMLTGYLISTSLTFNLGYIEYFCTVNCPSAKEAPFYIPKFIFCLLND